MRGIRRDWGIRIGYEVIGGETRFVDSREFRRF